MDFLSEAKRYAIDDDVLLYLKKNLNGGKMFPFPDLILYGMLNRQPQYSDYRGEWRWRRKINCNAL